MPLFTRGRVSSSTSRSNRSKDLRVKILYKYKDTAAEFHGGKVTDVR